MSAWFLLGAFAFGLVYCSAALKVIRPSCRQVWVGLVAAIATAAVFAALGHLGPALFFAGEVISFAWWLWRNRKRDRAASLIGEKTRALRDALVRRAREAAKPRPVLRPQPGGVRFVRCPEPGR
jgi:hypothetical protein